MTKTEIKAAVAELDRVEQIALAHELLQAAAPSPDWHASIVDERLAKHRANPEAAIPVADVVAKVFPELA